MGHIHSDMGQKRVSKILEMMLNTIDGVDFPSTLKILNMEGVT